MLRSSYSRPGLRRERNPTEICALTFVAGIGKVRSVGDVERLDAELAGDLPLNPEALEEARIQIRVARPAIAVRGRVAEARCVTGANDVGSNQ